jgi:hypothetical protein
MTFQDLRELLEPLGWYMRDGDLCAPSVGFWVGPSQFSDLPRLYGAVARRHERRHPSLDNDHHEYAQLLAALETIPTFGALGRHVREAHSLAQKWGYAANVSITAWEFSLPLVRLTARHPAGGFACIELDLERPPAASIVAFRWLDDPDALLRRHWKYRVAELPVLGTSLLAYIDRARLLILEARDLGAWPTSPISPLGSFAEAQAALDAEFPMLA